MRRKTTVLVLVMIFTAAICLVVFTRNGEQLNRDSFESEEIDQMSRLGKAPLIVNEDLLQLDNMSKVDIDEILDWLEPTKVEDYVSFDISASVLPGETLVTDVYEGQSGEFVISFITPEIKLENGRRIVQLDLKSRRINLAGGESPIMESADNVFEVPVGIPFSNTLVQDEGNYKLHILATDHEFPGIRLDVRGGLKRAK